MSASSGILNLFDRKIWGIRWVEIFGGIMVAAMVASIYVAKAAAARENARIAEIERQIDQNGQRVRLLRAQAARLEQPGRLEALSRQAGLGPVAVGRRSDERDLDSLAASQESEPAAAAIPVARPDTDPAASAASDIESETAQ